LRSGVIGLPEFDTSKFDVGTLAAVGFEQSFDASDFGCHAY